MATENPTRATHSVPPAGASPTSAGSPKARSTNDIVNDIMNCVCIRFGSPSDLEALIAEWNASIAPTKD